MTALVLKHQRRHRRRLARPGAAAMNDDPCWAHARSFADVPGRSATVLKAYRRDEQRPSRRIGERRALAEPLLIRGASDAHRPGDETDGLLG
jgi:hypothetical protein